MNYIVKNCPCGYALANTIACTCNEGYQKWCEYTDDCVIKQVIEACKKEAMINYPKKEKEFITVNGYQAILNMFDIEEVRE